MRFHQIILSLIIAANSQVSNECSQDSPIFDFDRDGIETIVELFDEENNFYRIAKTCKCGYSITNIGETYDPAIYPYVPSVELFCTYDSDYYTYVVENDKICTGSEDFCDDGSETPTTEPTTIIPETTSSPDTEEQVTEVQDTATSSDLGGQALEEVTEAQNPTIPSDLGGQAAEVELVERCSTGEFFSEEENKCYKQACQTHQNCPIKNKNFIIFINKIFI